MIVGGVVTYTAALHLMRTGAAGVLVGYDQHGQFELVTYPPGTPVRQVSGEWLIASAIDMVIVDGAPVASTVK